MLNADGQANGQTQQRTDMAKIIFALRKCAKAPKNEHNNFSA